MTSSLKTVICNEMTKKDQEKFQIHVEENLDSGYLTTIIGNLSDVVKKIPPIFCQRNTAHHAEALYRSGVLNEFSTQHASVEAVVINPNSNLKSEYSRYMVHGENALLEDMQAGRVSLVNGNTRNLLANQGLYEWHKELRLTIIYCNSEASAFKVYQSFDSKISHKSTRDNDYSQLRIADIQLMGGLATRMSINQVIIVAMSILRFGDVYSIETILGHKPLFKHDNEFGKIERELGMRHAMTAFLADAIKQIGNAKISFKNHPVSSQLIGAYVALLVKHRHTPEHVLDFIVAVSEDRGEANNSSYSATKLLCDDLRRIKEKKKNKFEKSFLQASRVFYCFDLFIKGKSDTNNRLHAYRALQMGLLTQQDDKELHCLFA